MVKPSTNPNHSACIRQQAHAALHGDVAACDVRQASEYASRPGDIIDPIMQWEGRGARGSSSNYLQEMCNLPLYEGHAAHAMTSPPAIIYRKEVGPMQLCDALDKLLQALPAPGAVMGVPFHRPKVSSTVSMGMSAGQPVLRNLWVATAGNVPLTCRCS